MRVVKNLILSKTSIFTDVSSWCLIKLYVFRNKAFAGKVPKLLLITLRVISVFWDLGFVLPKMTSIDVNVLAEVATLSEQYHFI